MQYSPNQDQTQALPRSIVVAGDDISVDVAQYLVFLLVFSSPVADGGK
jgi:hypothetical protein